MVFKSPFDYADPFGDTTAPVAQKPVQGNVGISPITMQGAVSIPAETAVNPAVSAYNNSYFAQQLEERAKEQGYGSSDEMFNNILTNLGHGSFVEKTPQEQLTIVESRKEAADASRKFDPAAYALVQQGINPNTGRKFISDTDRGNALYEFSPQKAQIDAEYNRLMQEAMLAPTKKEYESLKKEAADVRYKTGADLRRSMVDAETGDIVKTVMQTAPTLVASAFNPALGAMFAGASTAQAGGDLGDIAKAAAGAYIGGQAAAGGGMFSGVGQALAPTNAALASGISAGVASGVSTAVQGGDLGDVVKSGMLGGVGGYVSGLGTEAASLEQAAQAAGAAGDFSSSVALTMQANQLTQQAGLIGTIANSAKAIDAAIDGDYVSAITSGLNAAGTDLTKFTSDKITGLFGEEALANLNVDDIAAGVNKVATSLLDGKDFDNALQAGVKEYVQKGGSLGGAGDKIKDYLTAAGEGLYNDILKPAGDFLTGLVDNVQSFDTPDGIKAIEDVVRQVGSAIDDTVLQPIKEGAEGIYEPLQTPESVKAIEDAARTAGSAVDDAVLQPIREGLKDIDLPDVDVDLDFPSFDVGSFLMEGLQTSQTAGREVLDPVYADLSNRRLAPVSQEELFAEPDYLQKLLRTL